MEVEEEEHEEKEEEEKEEEEKNACGWAILNCTNPSRCKYLLLMFSSNV